MSQEQTWKEMLLEYGDRHYASAENKMSDVGMVANAKRRKELFDKILNRLLANPSPAPEAMGTDAKEFLRKMFSEVELVDSRSGLLDWDRVAEAMEAYRNDFEQRNIAICPKCKAKSQLTLTSFTRRTTITCGACRQWWSIGEIEHTAYFFGGPKASNGPTELMRCGIEGCTNPAAWDSKCEYHLAMLERSDVAQPDPWVDVKVGLPKEYQRVLVWILDDNSAIGGERREEEDIWTYCPSHPWWAGRDRAHRITHWRELPAPPETRATEGNDAKEKV